MATEVGPYDSDILVSNGQEIIECEIKVAAQDLREDFKKRKHLLYSQGSFRYVPNKFFFAVPNKLVNLALELTESTNYGVIEVSEAPLNNKRKQCFCKIVKMAKPLNGNFSEVLLRAIILRASSELIQIRIKADPDRLRDTIEKIRTLIGRVRALKQR